ncbi:hypothetical protein CONPUDRAFT_142779 [Coniophora puteana RWD-64-598 SS2]|uniref:BAH domain-containing protein n=1 Tax=Coniophora puteana (strain RWD-64-598) TaxID=741705 RepID=A0A5M3MZD5_CONPW|nr:uncharacterized protein CONPUDRAFT_142779 [Coniophora puteana RWD-64-598 SS2]EIW84533.1 hypothetical protein CONPUDRAFT_142779 [Coniophora puteana RWD-64-598 SS2]
MSDPNSLPILPVSTSSGLSSPCTIDVGTFFHARPIRSSDLCDGVELSAKYHGYEARFSTEFTRTKQAESAETTAARLKRANLLAEGWNMDDQRKSSVQAIVSRQEQEVQTFTVGDTVLVATAHALASVAVITSVWALVDPECPESKEVVVKLHWFLRPGQLSTVRAKGVRKPVPNEVYFSLAANAAVPPSSLITHCIVSFELALQPYLQVRRLRERFVCRLAVDNSRGLFYNLDWDDYHAGIIVDALPERKRGRPRTTNLEERTNGSMWSLGGESLQPLRRRESLSRSPSPGASPTSGKHKRRKMTHEDIEDMSSHDAGENSASTSNSYNDQSLRHVEIIKLGRTGFKLHLLDPVGPPRRKLITPAPPSIDSTTHVHERPMPPTKPRLPPTLTAQQARVSAPRQSPLLPGQRDGFTSHPNAAHTSASSLSISSVSRQTHTSTSTPRKATTQHSIPSSREQTDEQRRGLSSSLSTMRGPSPSCQPNGHIDIPKPPRRRERIPTMIQFHACIRTSASTSPSPLDAVQNRSTSSSPDPLAVPALRNPPSRLSNSSSNCSKKDTKPSAARVIQPCTIRLPSATPRQTATSTSRTDPLTGASSMPHAIKEPVAGSPPVGDHTLSTLMPNALSLLQSVPSLVHHPNPPSNRPDDRTSHERDSRTQPQANPSIPSTTPRQPKVDVLQVSSACTAVSLAESQPQPVCKVVTASGGIESSHSAVSVQATPQRNVTPIAIPESNSFDKCVDRLLKSVSADALKDFVNAASARYGGFDGQTTTICRAIDRREARSNKPSPNVHHTIVSGQQTLQ